VNKPSVRRLAVSEYYRSDDSTETARSQDESEGNSAAMELTLDQQGDKHAEWRERHKIS
jgi:hypothetical protein